MALKITKQVIEAKKADSIANTEVKKVHKTHNPPPTRNMKVDHTVFKKSDDERQLLKQLKKAHIPTKVSPIRLQF